METFTAIRAEVKNWRWAGVPFYLRTGKRMPHRRSEIVVQFKDVPHSIFPGGAPNRLVLRLQPSEGIELHIMAKEPGAGEVRAQAGAAEPQLRARPSPPGSPRPTSGCSWTC